VSVRARNRARSRQSVVASIIVEWARRLLLPGIPAFALVFLLPVPLDAKVFGVVLAALLLLTETAIELLIRARRERTKPGASERVREAASG
jgi:hypothetical protein